MNVTTLHEVEVALRDLDVETLREMTYQMAHMHERMCHLTSQEGGCRHVVDDETRDRVDALDHREQAALLAPLAWVAVELHDHIR